MHEADMFRFSDFLEKVFFRCLKFVNVAGLAVTYVVLANSLALFLLSGLSFSDMLWDRLVAFKFHNEPQEPGN